jgi:hypothetical protein
MLTASTEVRTDRSVIRSGGLTAFGAFLLYLSASLAVWGGSAILHLGSRYVAIGRVGDAEQSRWWLAWTPWALSHGRSPLFTDRVFAPQGVDLTWSALVPGPAIVAWPITRLFGTLAAYNILMLLAPALAAWAAFLVCRRLTHRFWPSVAGGYLFGFSTYMATQMQSHLNLVLIFPVPLAVYLVIRRFEGSLGVPAFVAMMSLTLLGLFSISTELFATALLFGAVAGTIAFLALPDARVRIAQVALRTVAASAIVGLFLLVPYLLPAIRSQPTALVRSNASADLLGFVVPRDQTLVGGSAMTAISARFTARVGEDASYVGLAGVLVLAGFGITERHRRGTWALLSFVGVVAILSLGSVLRIAGRSTITLPGRLLQEVPLIRHALASRFPAYAALAIGVIAAIWLSRAGGRFGWLRWVVVVAAGLMVVPIVRTPPWHYPDQTPTFFSEGTYSSVLHPDENVAMITGAKGEGMLWQATADFAFRMPWGYVGTVPDDTRDETHIQDLFVEDARAVTTPDRLARALRARAVTAVVLGDLARPTYEPIVRAAGLEPVYEGDGVSVWRFPS